MIARLAVLVAMALSSLVAGKADANYFDGNELLAWCENWHREPAPGDDLLLGGYCGGFVGGVVDVLVNKPNTFCVPQGPGGVRSAQLVEVVKLYLHDHPEKRNWPRASLSCRLSRKSSPVRSSNGNRARGLGSLLARRKEEAPARGETGLSVIHGEMAFLLLTIGPSGAHEVAQPLCGTL